MIYFCNHLLYCHKSRWSNLNSCCSIIGRFLIKTFRTDRTMPADVAIFQSSPTFDSWNKNMFEYQTTNSSINFPASRISRQRSVSSQKSSAKLMSQVKLIVLKLLTQSYHQQCSWKKQPPVCWLVSAHLISQHKWQSDKNQRRNSHLPMIMASRCLQVMLIVYLWR